MAATTYGENTSACLQGICRQIIGTSGEISTNLNNKWEAYLEAVIKKETQRSTVTRENIKTFLDAFSKDELGKENSTIITNEKLKDTLQDTILGMQNLPINEPEKISKEEQKILSVINTYFSEHIKEHLPNYNNAKPTLEEYKILINTLPESQELQKFALDPDKYSNKSPNISSVNTNTNLPKTQEAGKTTHQERLQTQREQSKQSQGRGI